VNKKFSKPKKSNGQFEVLISAAIGGVFMCALIVLAFFVPTLADLLIAVPDNIGSRGEITSLERGFIISDFYLMILVGIVAVVLMFVLLKTVLNGNVFTSSACKLLSSVSVCCFLEALLSIILVVYFQVAVCASLAACFLGLCLRIVKSVIAEATAIKEENDYTV
jgi:hypothetical protein